MEKQEKSSLKSLKIKNRHDVLELLRNADAPLAVSDISRRTALSKMTVHKILEHHVKKGLALAAGKGESGEEGGKRPTLFAFNPDYRFIFSIKISEMSLLAAVANLKAEIRVSQIATFDRETRLAEILRLIRDMMRSLTQKLSLRVEDCVGIVVGCHGITDSDAGIIVTSPHFSSWGSNIPIRERIGELFPFPVPVYVDNWIRYIAYGEMKTRRTRDKSFMVVGTEPEGIAAGLVMDGMLISGAKGLSGEIGHMIVDPSSADVCVCGGIGCLEVTMSLRRMEAKAWSRRSDWPDSALFHNGVAKRPGYAQIFRAANDGDAFARVLLDDAIRHLAVGINNVTQVCDPGLVLIQGEYARAGEYFINQLRERLRGLSLLRMDKGTRVEYSDHGDEWTLIGGAHYVADIHFAGAESRQN